MEELNDFSVSWCVLLADLLVRFLHVLLWLSIQLHVIRFNFMFSSDSVICAEHLAQRAFSESAFNHFLTI